MTKRYAVTILFLCSLLILCSTREASAQQFDISSGGQPNITGASGGSVTGSSLVTQNLVVTINFGEVSPINQNNIVKVVVPVAIRSNNDYQVAVSVAGTFSANAQAVQRSDIGFGVNNLRQLGNNARNCSNHTFRAPFNNDPSSTVTIGASGRAAYPSSLSNVGASTVVLSGPRLTQGSVSRATDNGFAFDAIFTIKPQFYVNGTFSATITFTISSGPNVSCN